MDLAIDRSPESGLHELATAMWNHAPRMWERMRAEKFTYPHLSHEEMAHLFAYLYTATYVEEAGDVEHGRQLFQTKNCARCHDIYGTYVQGQKVGPDLSAVANLGTPIAWAQAMWNHAPAMEASMDKLGLAWPKMEPNEMTDLLAYFREATAGPRQEFEFLPADFTRGEGLFREKFCAECHSLNGEGGEAGPELGPGQQGPLTIVEFTGLMWNHSPEMWREMKARGIERPAFEGKEMADLIAFLYTVGYFDSGGSADTGKDIFSERGCSHCHGSLAEGTSQAIALRGSGQNFTCVTLATALWRHGPKMYERTKELGLAWPALEEQDLDHLLAFLNSHPEGTTY